MFAPEAAALIGITPRTLRKYLRTTGQDQLMRSDRRYEFTFAEVEKLKEVYWATHPRTNAAPKTVEYDPQSQPLTTRQLRDPSMREQFARLRAERNERLHERLTAVGLSVPQMADRQLVMTGRARAVEVDA